MTKKRLALIAGGTSDERDVSLAGAEGIAKHLDPEKYEVVRYDPAEDLARLAAEAGTLDVAFILLHGLYGEDGTMQGFLDLLGVPYQGAGVLGSALAMDKNLAKTLYRLHGLSVADWRMAERNHVADASALIKELGLPLVVKPVRQGSSVGMSIVREANSLEPALAKAFEHDDAVMVEQYIKGRELTAAVLGNDEPQGLPLVEIIPDAKYDFFDYEAKYKAGASREVCPAEVSQEITRRAQEYGVKAHKALQLRGYSRTDLILDENNNLYLLETNTIPGMTPTSLFPQAAAEYGLSFAELLDRLIELALEK